LTNNIVIQNRKARYLFHFLDKWEVGIVLQGTEVKSLRDGKANLKDSYARIEAGEIFLYQFHISQYDKKEIRKLKGRVEEKGLTLVPLRVYFARGKAKIELALAKGKKSYDKRADIAKRDSDRDIEREFKRKRE